LKEAPPGLVPDSLKENFFTRPGRCLFSGDGRCHLGQSDLDMYSRSVELSMTESAHDAERCVHPSQSITDHYRTHLFGREPRDPRETSQGFDGVLEGRSIAPRVVQPKRRHASVDNVRSDFTYMGAVQAKMVHYARRKVLDHDITVPNE
jgi:hypothetical protein